MVLELYSSTSTVLEYYITAESQEGKLWIPIFVVLGFIRPGIELQTSVYRFSAVADALSTWPLIG